MAEGIKVSIMTDQYAVIGNPITHSKSPRIHTLFAEQTQQDICYRALLSPLDAFRETAMQFFKPTHEDEQHKPGKGLNVTVPFKQEAWDLCDELSDYAKLAGAVNTLTYQDDGRIFGTNTDGIGLVTDLVKNNQVALSGKNILVLGAGGAVRGVLQPLLEEHPNHLFVANRTVSKAQELAMLFGQHSVLSAGGFEMIPKEVRYDVVINGTAASLSGDLPPVPEACIKNSSCCYDMMYASEPTAFVKWASDLGVPQSLDGLGMLIEQAAESFKIWRGIRPDTSVVFSALRIMQ